MDDAQAQMLLKGVEVSIAVQKRMSMHDAEGCDEAIDSCADRYSLCTKQEIVLCAGDSELGSA